MRIVFAVAIALTVSLFTSNAIKEGLGHLSQVLASSVPAPK